MRLSERRQTASQTLLAVNTAIFGILVFLVKNAKLSGWSLAVISVPMFFVGALTSVIWLKTISDFRAIIGWHYEQLRAMELPLPDISRVYSKEWEHFFAPQQGKQRFAFTRLEAWLPRLFLGLYIVYGAALLTAVAFDWI